MVTIRAIIAPTTLAFTLASAAPASGAVVTDAVGDFLPTFVGPLSPDLDVVSFSVNYDAVAANFLLSSTLAGAISPSVPGIYVIGANTGTGVLAPFGSLGQPNVRFNQAIVLNKNGTGNIGATALSPASITITGNTISAVVPLSLLPSTGFAPQDYGFNIWPRNGTGNNNQISDFAPENATLAAVPEPTTWAMMILGFGLIGSIARLRRQGVGVGTAA